MKKAASKRKKLNKNSGTTLIELIVSFALLSLFMVAATKVISDTIVLYYQAKGITNGMRVSAIVTSKLTEEIEGALTVFLVDEDENKTRDYSILISEEGKRMELTDNTGSHIYITTNADGYLVIHYYPTASVRAGVVTPIAATDWTFDSKAYMGYKIKELTFTQPGAPYMDNVICVELTLSSGRYGDYSTTEYISLYNFTDEFVGRIRIE